MNVELPELPQHAAAWVIPGDDGGSLKEWVDAKAFSDGEFTAPLFSASQMQEYAKQAVLADRAAFNLSKYIIAANIRASDMPHVVVEKLAAAIRQSSPNVGIET